MVIEYVCFSYIRIVLLISDEYYKLYYITNLPILDRLNH
jgi:hypothetical protein